MNWVRFDRLKFYFLVILILVSLLQVGILWSFQDYGFPINFFDKKINASDDVNENMAKSLLKPFRIVVSEGYDGSRWIISNHKDSDYAVLWEDTKQYIATALKTTEQQPYMDGDNWVKLASDKTIIFEFKTGIQQNLLAWSLDISNLSDTAPKEVYKVMVAPWQNSGTLYIADRSRIYSFSLNIDENKLKAYDDIFNRYGESQENSLRRYTFIKELDPNNNYKLAFGQDALGIVKGPQYSGISYVVTSIPDMLRTQKAYSDDQVDEIANALLESEKDGYDRTIDSRDNTIEFKTQSKIYKLYKKGYLEYKFITGIQESDKGELKDAFMNAYRYLSKIQAVVSSENNFYISKIDENLKGYYTFKFDYMINGIPVVFTDNSKAQEAGAAVVIEANSRGVLNCSAQLRSFKQEKSDVLYNVYLGELLDNLFKDNKELKNNKGIEIKDIRLSYSTDVNSTSQEAKPVWVLEATGKNYIVPMYTK